MHMLAAFDLATGKIYYRIRKRKRWCEFLGLLKALRARWPGEKLCLVLDNFSPHKHMEVRTWAADNDVELVFLPTYGSWLNWSESEFAALRYFALNGAEVEKRGWTITGPWTAHGTHGDTLRAQMAPTPASLAWVDATYGPAPATPDVEAGERIVPVQRGWWDVISNEGCRYELTVRPTLTGPVWSVRHRSADGFETVATTGMAGTVLIGMRAHSAEPDHQPTDEGHPESR